MALPAEHRTYGDIDRFYVCVFEVKVSRSDFLNTFGGKKTAHAKARMEPVGTAHWVVADKGICKPEELPDLWGLVEPYGAGLTVKKISKLNILPEDILHSIAFDMLWQSMNHRVSYYDQVIAMARKVHEIKVAIARGKSIDQIRQLAEAASDLCHLRGM